MQIQSVNNYSTRLAQPAFRGDEDSDKKEVKKLTKEEIAYYNSLDSGAQGLSRGETGKVNSTIDKAITSEKMPKHLKWAIIIGAATLVGLVSGRVAMNRGVNFVDNKFQVLDGLANKIEGFIGGLGKKNPLPDDSAKGIKAMWARFVNKTVAWSQKGVSEKKIDGYRVYLATQKGMKDATKIEEAVEMFKKKGPIKRFLNSVGGTVGAVFGALKGSQDKDADGNPDGVKIVGKAKNIAAAFLAGDDPTALIL